LTAGGMVDEPLGRHPVQRKKRAVVQSGKPSVTHYRVITRFRAHTHVQLKLETGRTHQIRVHLASINHSLVGDPIYGQRRPDLGVQRPFLHAAELAFNHPGSEERVTFHSPLASDLQAWLDAAVA